MRKKKREIIEFVKGFDYETALEKLPLLDTEICPRLLTARQLLPKMLKLRFKSFWFMQLVIIIYAILNGLAVGYDCLITDQAGSTYINLAALGFLLFVINIGYKRDLKRKAHINHLYFILKHVSLKHQHHPEQCDVVKLLLIHKATFDLEAY